MSNKFRILIIDDNPEIHRDFIKILTTSSSETSELNYFEKIVFDQGEAQKNILPEFQIDTATQGKEGLKLIQKAMSENKPYSLAFVDIRMPPGWDGIETIKHIWKSDQDIQIVICTAYSDYSWEETIEHLGYRENLLILKKPFDHISVRQLTSALTKKWQLLQESREYTRSLQQKIEERTHSLKQSLSMIQHQATHDTLTELPNRALLIDYLQKAISQAKESKGLIAFLYFDLDRFKLINDSFNHTVGDELLKNVAKRLQAVTRKRDLLARLGGDEFVIVVSPLSQIEDAEKISDKLLDVFKEPFQIKGHQVLVTTSIGISLYPRDGDNIDELLRNADIAMYRSKNSGGNQFQFYDIEFKQKNIERLLMESDLRHAVANNEFFLTYQPQYDITTGKLTSVEALIRWQHPQKGIILPINFIPLAEETGLIIPIGEWVLKTACLQNRKWQQEGLPPVRISVNITTHQLRQTHLAKKIEAILTETQLSPEYLELEFTENVIIDCVESETVIAMLRNLGVSIALDDFGTGNSCLSYLRRISVDRIKIDRSFINNINVNHSDEVIIQAIIAMAKNMGLEVLAEGVENQQQLNFLKSKNCEAVQGFYYSEPLSEEEFTELLRNDRSLHIHTE